MSAIIVLTVTVLISGLIYLWDVYNYWRRKGVPGPTPLPILGNYAPVLFRTQREEDWHNTILQKYPQERFVGIYRGFQPVLLVRDPEVLKHVFIKDSHIFYRPVITFLPSPSKKNYQMNKAVRQPIQAILYKRSVFSTMVLKLQGPLNNYLSCINEMIQKQSKCDIRTLQYHYTIETMGAVIYGVQLNNFVNDSAFTKTIMNMVRYTVGNSFTEYLLTYPSIGYLFIPLALYKSMKIKTVCESFISKILDRYQSTPEEPKTLLEYLLQLQTKQKNGTISYEIEINNKYIAKQCLTMYISGIESVSYCTYIFIYELAHHPTVQEKLHREIVTILKKNGGELTTDAIYEMKYLEMVIKETMRLHLSYVSRQRKCSRPYVVPDSNILIDNRASIYFPPIAFTQNPKYYPNPHVFDPERFSPDNKRSITKFGYMPFSVGPLSCVGKY